MLDATRNLWVPEVWKGHEVTLSERMLKIDRRIIFLVIGLCTLLPLLYPVGLPIKISPEVRSIDDYRRLTSGARVGDVLTLYLYKPEIEQRALHTVKIEN